MDGKRKKRHCVFIVFCEKGRVRFKKVCGKKARKLMEDWEDEDDDDED